jgi:hypothetical protein
MKAVALFVVLAGYTAIAFGINHLTGGCVSFKNTIWPTTSTVTDPCAGTKTVAPAGGVTTGTSASAGVFGKKVPVKSNAPAPAAFGASNSNQPSTINPNYVPPGGYYIPGR